MLTSRSNGGRRATSSPRELDPALVGELEAGDEPQRRGLARARGAEQREELAARDVEVDAVDGREAAEALDQAGRRMSGTPEEAVVGRPQRRVLPRSCSTRRSSTAIGLSDGCTIARLPQAVLAHLVRGHCPLRRGGGPCRGPEARGGTIRPSRWARSDSWRRGPSRLRADDVGDAGRRGGGRARAPAPPAGPGRGAVSSALAALLAQLVEHFHGKEGVIGSSPMEGLQGRAVHGPEARSVGLVLGTSSEGLGARAPGSHGTQPDVDPRVPGAAGEHSSLEPRLDRGQPARGASRESLTPRRVPCPNTATAIASAWARRSHRSAATTAAVALSGAMLKATS